MKRIVCISIIYSALTCVVVPSIAHSTLEIHSDVLQEKRQLFIHLPQDYHQSDARYPVVYVLDGGILINAWPDQPSFAQHLDSLSQAGFIPDLIAVGIPNVDRIRDFNPTHLEAYPTSGGADRFLSFLLDEAVPLIDEKYRTNDQRILWGHSAAGLFSVFAFLSRPNGFKSYLAASPALSWDDAYVVRMAETQLSDLELKTTIQLKMALGENDYPNYITSTNRLVELLRSGAPDSLHWNLRIIPAADHMAVRHQFFINEIQSCFGED